MDRVKYQEILESIKVPEGISQEEMVAMLRPLNIALLQLIPERMFKYRICSDKGVLGTGSKTHFANIEYQLNKCREKRELPRV